MKLSAGLLSATILLCAISVFSRESSWIPSRENTDFGGYVKEIPLAVIEDSVSWSNLVQARFNTAWYPASFLSLVLQGRMLALSGDPFAMLNPITAGLDEDPNYLDLSEGWPAILYGNVDRAYLNAGIRKISARLGRQRINWGIAYVWNPNDWFNASSFFDFSYEEKRGTDALRISAYPTVLSAIELALGAGRHIADRTLAALYRFNRRAYDFQFQAGLFGEDLAAGAGWAGQIIDAGFRGELSYFHPAFIDDSFSPDDTLGNVVGVISGDYTFSNSLYLHAEALYNGFGSHSPLPFESFSQTFDPSQQITAKNLSPAKYSLFGEIAYNFTPLTRGVFSTIISRFSATDDYLFFWSPSFTWSMLPVIDLTLLAQVFYSTANVNLLASPAPGNGARGSDENNSAGLLAAEVSWSF